MGGGQVCGGRHLGGRQVGALLPIGSLLGRPGSLKRPKPLFGSLLGLFLFSKSPFSAKISNGSLFLGTFYPFKRIF